jgi:hypothetical protein
MQPHLYSEALSSFSTVSRALQLGDRRVLTTWRSGFDTAGASVRECVGMRQMEARHQL